MLDLIKKLVQDHGEKTPAEHSSIAHGLGEAAQGATEAAGELLESDNPVLALAAMATKNHEASEAHEKAEKAHEEAAHAHHEKAKDEHAKAGKHGEHGATRAAHEKSANAHEETAKGHEARAAEHGAKASEHKETGDNADFNAKHPRDEGGKFA